MTGPKTGGVANPQDGLGTAAETGNRAGDGYAGSFRNGRWNGLGVRSLGENPDNTVGALRQEGEFVDGALSFGVGYWRTGARYAGGYRNGKRNGPGVFTYPDGKRFEGELVDGHFAGYGVMWNPQGTAAEAGVWADDKMTTPLAPPRR